MASTLPMIPRIVPPGVPDREAVPIDTAPYASLEIDRTTTPTPIAEAAPIMAAAVEAGHADPDAPPATDAVARPGDTVEAEIDARIAEARGKLAARLAELERRVDHVKENLDPRTWIDSPWLRFALAAGIGYALGRSRMAGPLTKTLLGTAATTLVRRALAGGS